jgi:hypothetical protein
MWLEWRRAERDALLPHIREATFQIVREVAAPLVDEKLARIEWIEPTGVDGDWYADGAVTLIPARGSAAEVEVHPGALVTLLLGPRGFGHEIVVDKEGRWQSELRACLAAIVEGRYRERVARGRLAREVVTMTFELPGAQDNITVKRFDMTAEDPEPEGYGEYRYDAYA